MDSGKSKGICCDASKVSAKPLNIAFSSPCDSQLSKVDNSLSCNWMIGSWFSISRLNCWSLASKTASLALSSSISFCTKERENLQGIVLYEKKVFSELYLVNLKKMYTMNYIWFLKKWKRKGILHSHALCHMKAASLYSCNIFVTITTTWTAPTAVFSSVQTQSYGISALWNSITGKQLPRGLECLWSSILSQWTGTNTATTLEPVLKFVLPNESPINFKSSEA